MLKNLIAIFIFLFTENFDLLAQRKASINYLNQVMPGTIPVLFSKGIVSTEDYEHGSPAFSPKYDEIYWSIRLNGEYGKEIIMYISKSKNRWSKSKIPSFSIMGKGDLYPTFSIDGEEMYFTSDRFLPNSTDSINRFIWKVKRNRKDWSEPQIVGFDSLDTYGLSISSTNSLYFMAQAVKDRGTRNFDIYYSAFLDGKYSKPKKLEYPISTDYYEDCPFISYNENFLIFESNRPGGYGKLDLYISTKNKEGKWSEPKNLGKYINSESSERFPYISPDGKYFFFGSDRTGNYDIYWISSSVIYKLLDNKL